MSGGREGPSRRPALAVAWSGGKDSLHALHRALRLGHRVTHLFNVHESSSGRVRFHGVRRELIAAQAEALGLEPVQEGSGPDGFEAAFDRALERLREAGVGGVVFGNIHLEDIREWYESRTTARGFEHVEPLWGENPMRLVKAFLALGHRALVVSVDLDRAEAEWVGAELTPGLVRRMVTRRGADPCGERGEYHTFAWDGPLFREPVAFCRGEEIEMEGHRLLDLLPGRAEEDGR